MTKVTLPAASCVLLSSEKNGTFFFEMAYPDHRLSHLIAPNLLTVMHLSESLANRTAEFLHRYPPFSYLPFDEVENLAAQVSLKFFAQNDFVFELDEPRGDGFFVLQKGRIEILAPDDAEYRVIDLCDVGDLFGVRAMLTQNNYVASARADEESLVYEIPRAPFVELTERYPQVAMFFASGFAAGMTVVREEKTEAAGQASRQIFVPKSSQNTVFREEDVIVMKPTEQVAFCSPQNTVQEAAQIMAEYRIGSLVVANESLQPVGIITSADYTRRVGTGEVATTAPVARLMSSPVMTISKGITVAKVILTMMKHNIRHLVVTENGTPQSRFVGIVSEHDVLLTQGNNPAVLVKRLQKAHSTEEMLEIRDRAEELIFNYLEQEVSVEFITGTMTEINDALIKRAIEMSLEALSAEGYEPPPLTFAWLNLGSEGRGEQLLRTDQDNALLYQDPPPALAQQAKDYFLRLGKAVTDILEACGFAHCPGEIMASNPKWNLPLAAWKKQFSQWMHTPDPKALMHGTIFFDYRAGYGDQQLAQALTQHLFDEMEKTSNFINFFAQNALGNPPPLSFFKNFIVERSGKHKDAFDIKLRAMMPLCDAARVLMLAHRASGVGNTIERYHELAALEPNNQALFEEAAMAYGLMVRYRAINGFRNHNPGRYINPNHLNKIERQTLKYAFRTIDDLHSLLKTRFSLNYFQ
jgi:CBS domain-containing protein